MIDNDASSNDARKSHAGNDGMLSPQIRQVSATTWSLGSLTYTKVGLATLFAWLLFGDVAFMLRERSAAPVAQLMLKHFQACFWSLFRRSSFFCWAQSSVIGVTGTVAGGDVAFHFYSYQLPSYHLPWLGWVLAPCSAQR